MRDAAHRCSVGVTRVILRLGMTLLPLLVAADAMAQGTSFSSLPAPYDIDHLSAYAAQVSWRFVHSEDTSTLVCHGEGSAVFLGGNRFLTAAHVVDQNPLTDDCAGFGAADPVISFGPAQLTAKVLASAKWSDDGELTYPGGVDLAVLEVDARMIPVELRSAAPLALCASDPPEGTEVQVATEYGVFAARTQPPTNEEFARIDLAARGGHSGSGIFDPPHRCLVGIVSNGGVNGTNYVANHVLRHFLSEESVTLSSIK